MSEISKAIDRFLRENLDPILKAEGFRKVRRHYHRSLSDRIETVSVEASSWNMGGVGRFSVWLSVYLPEVARAIGREPKDGQPKGFESGVFTLLGEVMPERRQDHWTVGVDADNRPEAGRFWLAMEKHALPWFRDMAKPSSLIAFLVSRKGFRAAAIFCATRGEFAAADNYLNELANRTSETDDRSAELPYGDFLVASAVVSMLKGDMPAARKYLLEIHKRFPIMEEWGQRWAKNHGVL